MSPLRNVLLGSGYKGQIKGLHRKKKKKVKNKDHKMRRGKLEVLCYRMYRTEALTT